MATIELSQETFTSTIKENDFVLVDFWADWCGPCKRFAPIYSKVSDTHDDVVFGKVDTEANQQLAGSLGIQSIPTVMAFSKGNLVFSQPGLMNAGQLEKLIERVKEMEG